MSSQANESCVSETFSSCNEEVLETKIHELLTQVHALSTNHDSNNTSSASLDDEQEQEEQDLAEESTSETRDSIEANPSLSDINENSQCECGKLRDLVEKQRLLLVDYERKILNLEKRNEELEAECLNMKQTISNQNEQIQEDDQLAPLETIKSRNNILDPEGLDLPSYNSSSAFSRPSLANAVRDRRNKKMSVRDMARAFSTDRK